jgi:predicted DNA-binding transcriptional regulator YafY
MSFQDLAHYLQNESELQEYDFTVSQRTFQRDVKDIRKIYNVDIRFDRKHKVYKIDEASEGAINERIFEAYDTFNALNLSEKLSEHFHFENRKPQGTDNLHGLLHAIKKEVQINFIHYNYYTEVTRVRNVEPYALKEHKNRWYLIAKDIEDDKKTIKSFGLDRLSHLEITSKPFIQPKNFNVKDYFQHCFGIMGPNAKQPKEVVLSCTRHKGMYFKSLPLHESQKILIDNEDELRIKLNLYITHDFIIELQSHGDEIKIIQPLKLADKIKQSFKNAFEQYE